MGGIRDCLCLVTARQTAAEPAGLGSGNGLAAENWSVPGEAKPCPGWVVAGSSPQCHRVSSHPAVPSEPACLALSKAPTPGFPWFGAQVLCGTEDGLSACFPAVSDGIYRLQLPATVPESRNGPYLVKERAEPLQGCQDTRCRSGQDAAAPGQGPACCFGHRALPASSLTSFTSQPDTWPGPRSPGKPAIGTVALPLPGVALLYVIFVNSCSPTWVPPQLCHTRANGALLRLQITLPGAPGPMVATSGSCEGVEQLLGLSLCSALSECRQNSVLQLLCGAAEAASWAFSARMQRAGSVGIAALWQREPGPGFSWEEQKMTKQGLVQAPGEQLSVAGRSCVDPCPKH